MFFEMLYFVELFLLFLFMIVELVCFFCFILFFLKVIIINKIGGVVIMILIIEIYNVDNENLINFNFIWNEELFLVDDWKNMVLEIIISNRRIIKVVNFCIWLKWFMFGCKRRDIYKWWFVMFICVFVFISVLNECIFFFVDIGSIFLIIKLLLFRESYLL